jgi:hypothetical protein
MMTKEALSSVKDDAVNADAIANSNRYVAAPSRLLN